MNDCECDDQKGCSFPNCLPVREPIPTPESLYRIAAEILLGVAIAALVLILVGTYVLFISFGVQCSGRETYRAPIAYECWFERIKK